MRFPAVAAIVLAGLVGAHVAFVLLEPWGADAHTRVSNATQFTIEAAATVFAISAIAGMPRTRERTGWAILCAAAACYATGAGYLSWLDLQGATLTYPSLGDVFWLAYPLLATAAFLALSTPDGDARRWFVRTLDVLITGIGVFVVAWLLWFETIVTTSSGGTVARLVTAGYPLGDVMVITALLTFAAALPRDRWRLVWPLALGVGIIWGADIYYTWRSVHGDYTTLGIPEIAWPAGMALLAWGAVRLPHTQTAPARPTTPLDPWLPYAVALPALAIIGLSVLGGRILSGGITLIVLLWIGCILLRQFIFRRHAQAAAAVLAEQRILNLAAEHEARGLKEMTRFQTGFINEAAHELMTPLTPLKLGLARLRAEAPPGAAQSMDVMQRNLDRLHSVVSDIVEAAQLQSQQPLGSTEVDLVEVLREACTQMMPRCTAKAITLRLDAAPAAIVHGDPTRLRRAMASVLTHAIDATPEGGVVPVGLERQGDAWHASFTDTGKALAPGEGDALFEPFRSTERRWRTDGSVLGLFLARQVIERHHGRIGAGSAGAGQGACVWFDLPASGLP